MAAVKWIKIVTDIFDDEKILLVEGMPSPDSLIVIWFKLLCLAGKTNNSGVFMLSDRIHYTEEMLATIFRRDINTVRLALKTFADLGMIEIINDVITIPNWNKHQTLDAYEKKKERDRLYQAERRKKQKLLVEGKESPEKSSDTSSDVVISEEEREEEKELDKDIDIDINNSISKDILSSTEVQHIIKLWNSIGLQKVISIKPGTTRHKLLKARIKEFGLDKVLEAIEMVRGSNFLKGQNNKGWVVTFDWIIKPNNFIKVLEGNYKNKTGNNSSTNNKKNDLRFNDFKQREYDYDDLEQKLLGWD